MSDSNYIANYQSMIDELKCDTRVIAAILSGSRARGMGHQYSDTDIYVVITDGLTDEIAGIRKELRQKYSDSVAIDLSKHGVQNLEEFKSYGAIPSNTAWDRYALVHAKLEFDKSDGLVTKLYQAKQILTEEEKEFRISRTIPSYLNFTYRSISNFTQGNLLGARLDAGQATPFLIGVLFSLESRVTPFNKFLEWELEHYPLDIINSKELLNKLEAISKGGSFSDQRECLQLISRLSREQGYGEYIDGWHGKLDAIIK